VTGAAFPSESTVQAAAGPLAGVRVVELGGIGPVPFAGMTLADMGAEVVRIDRPGGETIAVIDGPDLIHRGKWSVVLDLKDPNDARVVRDLASRADILIEGWRPGVAERLGVGPEDCQRTNPALVYGRMTGWGQDGPLATSAGHDISYIAVVGALHAMGPADGPPQIPLNLVGDYGGGAMYLVSGVLAGLLDARTTGRGRVVDAAIVDGAAHLLNGTFALMAAGRWQDERGANLVDGGAPFYSVYATADEQHMAVGAIEPHFFAELLRLLELGPEEVDPRQQHDVEMWPQHRAVLARSFAARTQRAWTEVFAGTDACVAPVLSLRASARHPHVRARGTLVEIDGVLQAAPAPRFSGGSEPPHRPPARLGCNTTHVLDTWGISDHRTKAAH